MPEFEYRVTWSAATNITFRGKSDWMPVEDSHDEIRTIDAAEDALYDDPNGGGVPVLLEQALEASGFQWGIEVREVGAHA